MFIKPIKLKIKSIFTIFANFDPLQLLVYKFYLFLQFVTVSISEFKHQRQKCFHQMQKEEVFQDQFIKLNVGGTIYHTTLSTLLTDKDSMLAAMFSGRHKMVRQQDDSYFIDRLALREKCDNCRDGKHFRYVLNFLRGSTRTLPDSKQILGELAEEVSLTKRGIIFRLNSTNCKDL